MLLARIGWSLAPEFFYGVTIASTWIVSWTFWHILVATRLILAWWKLSVGYKKFHHTGPLQISLNKCVFYLINMVYCSFLKLIDTVFGEP